MLQVIILKGLPASGKTTWAKKLQDEYPNVYKRVNKDDLRAMLDNSRHTDGNENFVLLMRNIIITHALTSGKSVIVDDTNFHPSHEEEIRGLVETLKACYNLEVEVIVKEFDANVGECIFRDAKRTGSAHVGEEVIKRMDRERKEWRKEQ